MIRHVFILNPEAGVKSSVYDATARIEKAFLESTDLQHQDESYEIHLTRKKGHATRLARRACEENITFAKRKYHADDSQHIT